MEGWGQCGGGVGCGRAGIEGIRGDRDVGIEGWELRGG